MSERQRCLAQPTQPNRAFPLTQDSQTAEKPATSLPAAGFVAHEGRIANPIPKSTRGVWRIGLKDTRLRRHQLLKFGKLLKFGEFRLFLELLTLFEAFL